MKLNSTLELHGMQSVTFIVDLIAGEVRVCSSSGIDMGLIRMADVSHFVLGAAYASRSIRTMMEASLAKAVSIDELSDTSLVVLAQRLLMHSTRDKRSAAPYNESTTTEVAIRVYPWFPPTYEADGEMHAIKYRNPSEMTKLEVLAVLNAGLQHAPVEAWHKVCMPLMNSVIFNLYKWHKKRNPCEVVDALY